MGRIVARRARGLVLLPCGRALAPAWIRMAVFCGARQRQTARSGAGVRDRLSPRHDPDRTAAPRDRRDRARIPETAAPAPPVARLADRGALSPGFRRRRRSRRADAPAGYTF